MSIEYSRNILEISEYLDIFMPKKCFEYYMSQIYNSIITQNTLDINDREDGISLISFNIYLNLPFFISQKIFHVIKNKNDDYLSEKEFVDFFSTIYYGTIEERAKLIFKILDIDNDNLIQIEDLKLFSYHFQSLYYLIYCVNKIILILLL